MAPPLNWRTAFLIQAKSDFEVFRRLSRTKGIDPCHRLHYLQMALEKLMKFLVSSRRSSPETRHDVAKFLDDANRYQNLMRQLGFNDKSKFRQYLKEIKSIVVSLEQLHPTGKEPKRNLEYPWEERKLLADGSILIEVFAPAKERWQEADPKSIKKLLHFMENCFQLD